MIARLLKAALAPLVGLSMFFGASSAQAFTVDCWHMEGGIACVIVWIRDDGSLATVGQMFPR